jgi:hypothetical protein
MQFKSLVLGTLLAAGSAHGSILLTASGLASPGFIQTFASPALTAGTTSTPGTTVTNQFSNITLSNNGTGLFYDPNGAGNCQTTLGTATPNIAANCVGNFLNTGLQTNVNGDPIGNPFTGGALPSITITFLTPGLNVAFILATNDNGNPSGAGGQNSHIKVYAADGVTVLEETNVHTSLSGASPVLNGNWIDISEGVTIGRVVISSTGNDETGQTGTATLTPWAALVGNVEGTATISASSEPASMTLFGGGLAALGFFSRRRRA